MARTTGKPILVVDQPDDDAARSVHGMFLSLPDRDVVVVSAGVERVHRDHVLMHEMAHLLLGHQLTGSDFTSDLSGLFTKLDPGLVASVLGRNHYSDPQEREAEWLASRIMLGTRGLNRGAWIDDPRLRRAAATVASLP